MRAKAWAVLGLAAGAAPALAQGGLKIFVFPRNPTAGRDAVIRVRVCGVEGEAVEGAFVEVRGLLPSMGLKVEGRTRHDGTAILPFPAKRGGLAEVRASVLEGGEERVLLCVRFYRFPWSAVGVEVALLGAFLGLLWWNFRMARAKNFFEGVDKRRRKRYNQIGIHEGRR